jgi:hypothetical protein
MLNTSSFAFTQVGMLKTAQQWIIACLGNVVEADYIVNYIAP